MKTKSYILCMAIALVSFVLTGCEAIMDHLQPCPTGLYVHFRYDYNVERADMFHDQCGSVTLYVFDADSALIRQVTVENIGGKRPLSDMDFAIKLDSLPSGKYHFLALAHQRPLDEIMSKPGAKYRRAALAKGDDMKVMNICLDREARVADSVPYPISTIAPLDTLWHGMSLRAFLYDSSLEMHDTVSLMRDTKMLTVGLHQIGDSVRTKMHIEDYDIFIVDDNRCLDFDNSVMLDDDIVYRPFAKWNTGSVGADGTPYDSTAHATLTFNRLMTYGDAADDAILCVRHIPSDSVVVALNLPSTLLQGRNYPNYQRYAPQEFLDRQHDYYLDFFLLNGQWKYAVLRLNILSWEYRIQNLKL